MDPVIGRDDEIRRTIRILSRKTKNNPVLIGEPGVGKTAIVGRPRPAYRSRRRSGKSEGKNHFLARYGRVAAGAEIPRRIRRAAQGRSQRNQKIAPGE